MAKAVPESQDLRDLEASMLLNRIASADYPKLTTYERQLVEDVHEGKAITRVRLLELRAVFERLGHEK